MANGFVLGIDFGTSSTVAVLRRPDGAVTPLLFDASPLFPSGVFAAPGAELLTGADAVRAGLADPGGFESSPKRLIDDRTVWLGEQEVPVVDLIAAVLGRVSDEARRVAGQPPSGVVLTHPAAWSRTRLSVLAAAADRAGLGEVGLVAEPVAAAAYFASVLGRTVPVGRFLLVFDLGAGTVDVSVLRRTPVGFDMAAADGLADLGGMDLDAVVVNHARSATAGAVEKWHRLDWPQTCADLRARHSLWRDARAAKEQLSRRAAANLYVPLVETNLHLTREEFEKAAQVHLDRAIALTMTAARNAAATPETIAAVLLVGGSTRIPIVATLLHRALHVAPTVIDQPELVVAAGSVHTGPPRRGIDPIELPIHARQPTPSPILPVGLPLIPTFGSSPTITATPLPGQGDQPRRPSDPVAPVAALHRSRPAPPPTPFGAGQPTATRRRTSVAVVAVVISTVLALVLGGVVVMHNLITGDRPLDPQAGNTAGPSTTTSESTTGSNPFIGLLVQDTADGTGATVVEVTPDGPGATAGVRSGDIVIQAGLTLVRTADHLRAALQATAPGNRLLLTLTRNRLPMTLTVTVGATS